VAITSFPAQCPPGAHRTVVRRRIGVCCARFRNTQFRRPEPHGLRAGL